MTQGYVDFGDTLAVGDCLGIAVQYDSRSAGLFVVEDFDVGHGGGSPLGLDAEGFEHGLLTSPARGEGRRRRRLSATVRNFQRREVARHERGVGTGDSRN